MIVPRRTVARVRIRRHQGTQEVPARDVVAVEEPLEIRLAWRPEGRQLRQRPVAVTMRTPGDDFELAAGFLFSEGLIPDPAALEDLTYCTGAPQRYNVVEAHLRPGYDVDPSLLDRNFYTSSSCGVCGRASLDAVAARGCAPLPPGTLRLDRERVARLPLELSRSQPTFSRTGGLHGAGLFDGDGRCLDAREDVGRHNAVDKVVGAAFLRDRLPLADHVLVVSGRVSFELVQKAVAAGIPALVAVGAPSSLAVDLAARFGLTLVGFARDDRFNVYAGGARIGGAPHPDAQPPEGP